MSTGNHRDAGKERLWRRMVRQWRASGLSVRAFCEEHELPEGSFYGWRRTLAERDAQSRAFVAVHVAPEAKATCTEDVSASGLELKLAQGRVLCIRRGFDAETLRQLLALLEEGQAC